MRLSAWAALPFYVLPLSALALPTPSKDSTDAAVAGPIATHHVIHVTTELETEYEKLEDLKAKLHELHHRVSLQEHAILKLINQDFKSCTGVQCYVQTAIREAPDFFEFLKTHFRHHPLTLCPETVPCPPKDKLPSPSNDPEILSDASVTEDVSPTTSPDLPDETPSALSNNPFQFDERPERPHHPPFAPVWPGEFHKPGEDHRLPFEPPKDWHPPHGPPFDHAPWKDDKEGSPWKSDREDNPWTGGKSHGPWKPHHHGPHHMPHPAPRHRHYRLILATAGLFITLVIFAILFKAIRIYLANPRVRASRAARREEIRTRREYKRAACQHRLKKMFAQLLQRSTSRRCEEEEEEEEEEKENILQTSSRESRSKIIDHIVGPNIESLRRAHEIVGQLMRAEEGRAQGLGSFSPSSPSVGSALSVVTTLPPYALPPPRYSQEISRDMEVVDGFRYTPSNSEATPSSASSFVFDDDTTESSVVDCQSRMSMETDGLPLSRKSLELAGDRYRRQFN